MARVDGSLECDFCGKDQSEVLNLAAAGKHAICDDCVDVCIAVGASKGVIPDLKPLEGHFLFKPYFLTENDIRADLSKFEYESLTDNDQREALIAMVADRMRKDELTKLIVESLNYRMHEILCRALEEFGLAHEETLRPELLEALGSPRPKQEALPE